MPEYARTAEVAEAAGVSRQTLRAWVKRGLLPEPTLLAKGRGVWSRWPLEAVEIARFIRAQRDKDYTLDEIAEQVRERWAAVF
ncbi:MAG: MerR family transcriptional regulator [Nannocystaceae bacterium]